MNVEIVKHGETKNGTFWAQIRVGDLNIVGWGHQADSFEKFKRNFRFIFDSEKSCKKLQELLDDKVKSELRQAVKRAWMVVKQPVIDHVTSGGEIVLKK